MKRTIDQQIISVLEEAIRKVRALGGAPVKANGKAEVPATIAQSGSPTPDAVLAHIARHPGLRSELIARSMGVESVRKEVAALRQAGWVRTRGEKRGTVYFARASATQIPAEAKKVAAAKRARRPK